MTTVVRRPPPWRLVVLHEEMRMVFLAVTATALRWGWQRTVDGGATWSPMMIIDYRRRASS